jgi:hypothetical protein
VGEAVGLRVGEGHGDVVKLGDVKAGLAVAKRGCQWGRGPGGDGAQRWLVSATLRNGTAMLEGGAAQRKGG